MNDDDKDFFKLLNISPSYEKGIIYYNIPGCIVYDNFILSFLPVHPDFLKPFSGNIHACAYKGQVMREDTITVRDDKIFTSIRYDHRYLSFTEEPSPIGWEDCKKRFQEQQPCGH